MRGEKAKVGEEKILNVRLLLAHAAGVGEKE